MLVATKGSAEADGDSYRNGTRPETLRRHVNDSVRRLGIEQPALHYLHEPATAVPIDEDIGKLDTLRSNGKIALLGFFERHRRPTPQGARYSADRSSSEPL